MNYVNRVAAMATAAAACTIGSAPAHAELYKFHLTGRAEYSDSTAFPDVPVGTKVSGSFVYDTEAEPGYVFTADAYAKAAYDFPRQYAFKLWFGGHSVRAIGQVIPEVTDGVPGRFSDIFQMSIDRGIKVDGVPCQVSTCYFGLMMKSLAQSSDVLTSVALPSSFDVRRFDEYRYGYVRNHVDNSMTLQFTIDSIKSERCLSGADPRTACDD